MFVKTSKQQLQNQVVWILRSKNQKKVHQRPIYNESLPENYVQKHSQKHGQSERACENKLNIYQFQDFEKKKMFPPRGIESGSHG